MANVLLDYANTTRTAYNVIGQTSTGEFVISGPWSERLTAEFHGKLIVGLLNECLRDRRNLWSKTGA